MKLSDSRMNVEAAVVDIRVKVLVHADGGSEGNRAYLGKAARTRV